MDPTHEEHWLPRVLEFERAFLATPAAKKLSAAQAAGTFTQTPLSLSHYAGALALLSDPSFVGERHAPIRVLDVGAYLNLFSAFVNELRDDDGNKPFLSTGLERDPRYCELSNDLFESNRVICDDIRRPSKLGEMRFDVVLFCNFFHFDTVPSRADILAMFESVDAVLEPGGLVCNRHSYRDIVTPERLTLHPAEGGEMSVDALLPAGYTSIDGAHHHVWNVVRKTPPAATTSS